MPMSSEMSHQTLEELLGLELNQCSCGKTHFVPTREALLQPGAMAQLHQLAARRLPPGPLLCIADTNTWAAAGETAVSRLRDNGRTVEVYLADQHGQALHADDQAVQALTEALRRAKAVGLLAVGSGTINDIAKSAATLLGCPQITVATAASMNGYPSAISALTVNGVKVTEPCRPPVAIIADPQILATAPARMTGAGFGDLLSKNASTADWLLAHHLLDEYYCPFAAAVAEQAVQRCINAAPEIKRHSPEGLAILAEALVRSGISMVLAGSSAPASGGEHLLSHLWDMTAHWTGRTPALHGQQTGVTTLISLKLYEKLLALDEDDIRRLCQAAAVVEERAGFEAHLTEIFGDIASAVLPFARQKYLDADSLQAKRRLIQSRWPAIRKAVAGVVISAATSRSHLQAAGAVVRTADLGLSAQETAFAYRYARWIRNRYTVLDLTAELGMLELWESEILSEV
jgi:glycerol-1-phosphate dehydrogenase [NAD(P)+]